MGEGRLERRGLLHHILSGEHYYFRDWATLVSCLDAKLQGLDGEDDPQDTP
jgi:hypothetical protein